MTHVPGIYRDHKPALKKALRYVAKIPCACGCGTMIDEFDRYKCRPRKYASGHFRNTQSLPGDTWSEEKKDEFRQLWMDGATCREIADVMGMPRNSVPGRANRMGLPGRGSPLNLTREQRSSRAKAQRAREAKARKPKSALTVVADNFAPNQRKPIQVRKVARPMVDIGESRNLIVGQLSRETCAYPTKTEPGNTHSGLAHSFCGNPVAEGCSYCAGHQSIVFIKPAVIGEEKDIAA